MTTLNKPQNRKLPPGNYGIKVIFGMNDGDYNIYSFGTSNEAQKELVHWLADGYSAKLLVKDGRHWKEV